METIKYLGWKQPYAQLMLPPFLKKETRKWNTKYRGKVMITASKNSFLNKVLFEIAGQNQYYRINKALQSQRLLYGYAIGVADLVDVRPMLLEDEDATFVKFNPLLYVWTFENQRAIQPFEYKGSQGFRTLNEETISKIIYL
jgi:hypothetical protein